MKCKKCNTEIEKNWNFCPICGSAIKKAVTIPFKINLSGDFDDFDEIFEQTFKEVNRIFKAFGFPGQLEIKTSKKVPIKLKPQNQEQQQEKERIIRFIEEPKTKIERTPSSINVELQLPGVGTMSNISIKKLEESIEIRAYAGDKMYFKLIPVRPGADISERKFANDVLTIKIKM